MTALITCLEHGARTCFTCGLTLQALRGRTLILLPPSVPASTRGQLLTATLEEHLQARAWRESLRSAC